MEHEVEQLVNQYQTGRLSRRVFLRRAALILGGAAAAEALLLAASGSSIPEVAQAAGVLQGTAAPTAAATIAPPPGGLEIDARMVTFQGNGEAPGYFARPTADGTYPGLVVIQEWWGLDDHIISVTQRFASQGFAALAPDLYRGHIAKEPNDAQHLVMTVQRALALQDIQGATDYLNQQSFVLHNKVGVIGFCFGGGLAMQMALQGKGVGAVASFYGSGVDPSPADVQNAVAPVIGFYGDKDQGFPADKINTWAERFKAAGKIYEPHIYAGAAHAFFNDTRSSYAKEAAQDAWKRTLDWFHKYLTA